MNYNQMARADEFRLLAAMQANKDVLATKTLADATAYLSDMLHVPLTERNVSGVNRDAGLGVKFKSSRRERADGKGTERLLFHWHNEQDGHGIMSTSEVLAIHQKAIMELASMLDVPLSKLGLDRLTPPEL